MTISDRTTRFRGLHDRAGGRILVLPNAWDPMSARVIEEAGASAIATTSAGVSWTLGRPDGHGAARDDVLAVVRRIVSAVTVPVTADVESGYDDLPATVRGVIAAGASGINLEDSPGRNDAPLLEPAEQASRIAAARSAAADSGLFINARTDVYLRQVGPESGRFEETVRRAKAYAEAGADGLFVPGLVEPEAIRRIAAAVSLPLNILARAGAPSTGELARLGVARVSVGPMITLGAMTYTRRAAAELLGEGTYRSLTDIIPYPEANGMFNREQARR